MSANIENLLTLARRAKENKDNASAARYYEQILVEEPNNWEAVFYYDYCKSATCVIANIEPAAYRVGKAFQTAFNIIKEANIENSFKKLYLITYAQDALYLLLAMWQSAYAHKAQYSDLSNVSYEYKCRAYACGSAAKTIGDCFYSFGDRQMAATCYENAYELSDKALALSEQEIACIKQFYPDFKIKTAGGCYVATAVYGSYDCPQVWALRRYRDNILAETWLGRAFIKTYYAISPTLVKWFGKTEWFKNMWRGQLDRMVEKLQSEGVESTPYEDKNW